VHCVRCGQDDLVAFSCKGRGFCPSCGGRRTADTAAAASGHLVTYQGVLAPAARTRRRGAVAAGQAAGARTHVARSDTASRRTRAATTAAPLPWAELTRRVFAKDVLVCGHSGGPRRVRHRELDAARRRQAI